MINTLNWLPLRLTFNNCLPIVGGSLTTKTGRHDIAEILLKVALNTKNQSIYKRLVSLHSNS